MTGEYLARVVFVHASPFRAARSPLALLMAKILIVDDEPDITSAFARFFERMGARRAARRYG